MPVPLKNTIHSIAGVYRCCLASWKEKAAAAPEQLVELGEEIECRHCKAKSRLTQIDGENGLFEQLL